MGVMIGSIYAAKAAWNEDKAFEVGWARIGLLSVA
jgi:hypothetical protein